MQEVAAILSKALPEYKWKSAGKGEKVKQYCDNSKVSPSLQLPAVPSLFPGKAMLRYAE